MYFPTDTGSDLMEHAEIIALYVGCIKRNRKTKNKWSLPFGFHSMGAHNKSLLVGCIKKISWVL